MFLNELWNTPADSEKNTGKECNWVGHITLIFVNIKVFFLGWVSKKNTEKRSFLLWNIALCMSVVKDYQPTQFNIPEGWRSRLHCEGILKSRRQTQSGILIRVSPFYFALYSYVLLMYQWNSNDLSVARVLQGTPSLSLLLLLLLLLLLMYLCPYHLRQPEPGSTLSHPLSSRRGLRWPILDS
jgi:hypothetical protein